MLRPRGSGVHGIARPALVALAALSLASCEADHVAARATLADWGYRGAAIERAPMIGRPCRFGEPYAVRFAAHDEAGRDVSGFVCAVDEATENARILVDREGGR